MPDLRLIATPPPIAYLHHMNDAREGKPKVYEEIKITLVGPGYMGAYAVVLIHGDRKGGRGGPAESPWTEAEARVVFRRAAQAAAVVIGGAAPSLFPPDA